MSTRSDLTFDPGKHEYRLAGVVIPHVTGILEDAGLVSHEWSSAWALDRGSKVHLLCQLDDEGDLDEASVDPRLAGYLDAWRRYKREMKVAILAVERAVMSGDHGYAGTLDRIVLEGAGPQTLLDIKSGNVDDATGLQTAAYQRADYEERGVIVPLRCAVHLRSDGRYERVPYNKASDWLTFQAALTVLAWRRSHGR